jgi:hypothetical protein
MTKLRSRLARLSAGGAGIAPGTAGLALSVPGCAQAQKNKQPQTTPVSCGHNGNGYTGGPHVSGTKWTKQASKCGNFRWEQVLISSDERSGLARLPGIDRLVGSDLFWIRYTGLSTSCHI